eukprot:2398188-Pyramimonas_sp.AAC.1
MGGELNFPGVEWLNKGLTAARGPTKERTMTAQMLGSPVGGSEAKAPATRPRLTICIPAQKA